MFMVLIMFVALIMFAALIMFVARIMFVTIIMFAALIMFVAIVMFVAIIMFVTIIVWCVARVVSGCMSLPLPWCHCRVRCRLSTAPPGARAPGISSRGLCPQATRATGCPHPWGTAS